MIIRKQGGSLETGDLPFYYLVDFKVLRSIYMFSHSENVTLMTFCILQNMLK